MARAMAALFIRPQRRLPVTAFMILVMAMVMTLAHAEWVSICPGEAKPEVGATILAEYSYATGGSFKLLATHDEQAGCASKQVSLASRQIVWAGLVPVDLAQQLGDGVILQGMTTPAGLRVSEILPLQTPRTPSTPPFAPLDADLLASLEALPFGVEERASVTSRKDSPLAAECRAGSRPAGVMLRSRSWILPRGLNVAVDLRYRASAAFPVGVSDRERLAREQPRMIGTLASNRDQASFDLPATEPEGALALSLHCPEQAARLEINSLRIIAPESRKSIPARAMWAWRPQWWINDALSLLANLRDGGADTVYVTIPMAGHPLRIEHSNELQRFIGEATRLGIKVWSVDGEPRAVLPEAREEYLQRAKIYREYNRGVAEDFRLQGVQYDIEPYLVPGYSLAIEEWLRAYLETIAAFKAELGMPVELAVPYWWANQKYAGSAFLDRLAASADSLAVMNYSTNPESIRAAAEPFLAWSSRFKRGVRMALEAGPIEDEQRRYYKKSDAGELWQFELAGQHILLLLDHAMANPAGSAFAYSRSINVPGRRISFAGNTQRMFEQLPELENLWSAWPGFAGIALHGVLL
jgi:hypothetical protein